MGLLNYYDHRNRVTYELLSVVYDVQQIFDSPFVTPDGQAEVANMWRIRRVATKRYAYVGMNEATAKACVAAKNAQYTYVREAFRIRTRSGQQIELFAGSEKTIGAAITSTLVGGGMYNVDIAVNVNDSVVVNTNPTDPESHFHNIDFDEGADPTPGTHGTPGTQGGTTTHGGV